MTLPSPDALGLRLSSYTPLDIPALPGRRNDIPSAVLVPLVWAADDLHIILTLRAKGLRAHGGEVSFPGGRPDPGDENLMATALREAEEEIGARGVRVLGQLSAMPLYTSDYRMTPFVGALSQMPDRPNPQEVAKVLVLPTRQVFDSPHLDAIPWSYEGNSYQAPVFHVEGHAVFGGTAYVLMEMLQVLGAVVGRSIPPLKAGRYAWTDFLRGGYQEERMGG